MRFARRRPRASDNHGAVVCGVERSKGTASGSVDAAKKSELFAVTAGNDSGPSGRRYLEELLACPGVEEEVVLRSRVGFMAFHGGSLEEHTDTIATAAARNAEASLYVVRQPDNLRWHLPSTFFRPDESPKLQTFFKGVDVVVTLHGFRREKLPRHVLLGGRNRRFARHVASCLRASLVGYVIEDELERIPASIRGVHADNPVNVPLLQGVQVELPPEIRHENPFWGTPRGQASQLDGGDSDPERLVRGLALAARSFEDHG